MDWRVRRNSEIVDSTGREITLQNGNKIYVLRSGISGPKEDGYNTRMSAKTLTMFVEQGSAGVPVCPNHTKEVITGFTSNAEQDENGVVYCDLNIDMDLPYAHPEAGYPNSDVLIRQLKAGRIKMTSIGGGFNSDTQLLCNICDKDQMSDMSCEHWQGVYYDKTEIADKEKQEAHEGDTIKCVPEWDNLDLCEVSTVYSGANPDANIVQNRADLMLENGLLKKSDAARLNHFYGLSIDLSRAKPDKSIIDLGKNNKRSNMPPEELTAEQIQQLKNDKAEAERKVKEAEDAKKAAEAERDKYKTAAGTLEQEESAMRAENIRDYKKMRGDAMTGEELTGYEQKQESLNLTGLKTERLILDKALGNTSEEGGDEEGGDEGGDNGGTTTKSGRSTSDKDNSKNDGGQKVAMPSWFNLDKADDKSTGAQS